MSDLSDAIGTTKKKLLFFTLALVFFLKVALNLASKHEPALLPKIFKLACRVCIPH